MQLSYVDLCTILGIPPQASVNPVVDRVAYDSREVEPNALFVCMKGERTDGHTYVSQACERGAAVILAEHPVEASVPVVLVPKTLPALMRIAQEARTKTRATVIGLTGTSGKTTVKEMLAHVLAMHGTVAKSPANHNTQLGMACGILAARGDEDYWVFEAGVSHEGDMEQLGGMLCPDVALILNVGSGHTEGLGDKGVAWHKTRLLEAMSPKGIGIVSADYPDLVWKAYGTHKPLHFFSAKVGIPGSGHSTPSANYARWLGENANGFGTYRVCVQGEEFDVETPLTGAYGAENVIACALVAHCVGVPKEAICEGLKTVTLPGQRFVKHQYGRCTLIDDTYNANPLSMNAMLDEAARMAREKQCPLVLVLGEMRELGQLAQSAHRSLGEKLAALQPKVIFWKGGEEDSVRKGLASKGYTGALYSVRDAESFADMFSTVAQQIPSFVLLAKGSRANELEDLLARVQDTVLRKADA
ncbi:MAG: UDP-N-acetylmuramoyl-tripeptide--D-alanyl-D-alanine ligase [Desulfovibrio sp.]|nr:UDP-N-acetylmuramoyl-tripeptide--D-alanyl-D-alanine ligase [Desulfovibrio sp.]